MEKKGSPTNKWWQFTSEDLSEYYQKKLKEETQLHFIIDFYPHQTYKIGLVEIVNIFLFTMADYSGEGIEETIMRLKMQDIFYLEDYNDEPSYYKGKIKYIHQTNMTDFTEILFLHGDDSRWHWQDISSIKHKTIDEVYVPYYKDVCEKLAGLSARMQNALSPEHLMIIKAEAIDYLNDLEENCPRVFSGVYFLSEVLKKEIVKKQKYLPILHSSNALIRGSRILICNDNEELCRFLKEEFSGLSFNIDIVFNGRRAIEVLEEKDYDLLLLNLEMPEVDGFTVLQYVRRNFSNLPVIVHSLCHQEWIINKCYELEAYDYVIIEYPVKWEVYLSAIVRALEHKELITSLIFSKEESKRQKHSTSVLSNSKILICNDDKIFYYDMNVSMYYYLLKTKLEKRGFIVDTISNGRYIAKNLNYRNYDLIIIKYPIYKELYETIKYVYRNNPNIPIIILSNRQDPIDMSDCLEMYAHSYYILPCKFEVLLRSINRILVPQHEAEKEI